MPCSMSFKAAPAYAIGTIQCYLSGNHTPYPGGPAENVALTVVQNMGLLSFKRNCSSLDHQTIGTV